MKIGVLLNPRAGHVNEEKLKNKLSSALFRCDLVFLRSESFDHLKQLFSENWDVFQALIVCGGDGTVNGVVHALMGVSQERPLPAICLVPVGTANDLASEIGVSRKVEKAARLILEGKIKKIDLIELRSDDGQIAFLTTCGGVGIPAMTAQITNQLRRWVHDLAVAEKNKIQQFVAKQSKKILRHLGSGLYPLATLKSLTSWRTQDWSISLEMPKQPLMLTTASSILISNQPSVGRAFTPAPYTTNSDGLLNVLVTDASRWHQQAAAALSMIQGRPESYQKNQSFETPSLTLRSQEGSRLLTFFGDGEILMQDVRQIEVRCIPKMLSIYSEDMGSL